MVLYGDRILILTNSGQCLLALLCLLPALASHPSPLFILPPSFPRSQHRDLDFSAFFSPSSAFRMLYFSNIFRRRVDWIEEKRIACQILKKGRIFLEIVVCGKKPIEKIGKKVFFLPNLMPIPASSDPCSLRPLVKLSPPPSLLPAVSSSILRHYMCAPRQNTGYYVLFCRYSYSTTLHPEKSKAVAVSCAQVAPLGLLTTVCTVVPLPPAVSVTFFQNCTVVLSPRL